MNAESLARHAAVVGRLHYLAKLVGIATRAAVDEPALLADVLPAIAAAMDLVAELAGDLEEALTPVPGVAGVEGQRR